jgi:hypothetical protein
MSGSVAVVRFSSCTDAMSASGGFLEELVMQRLIRLTRGVMLWVFLATCCQQAVAQVQVSSGYDYFPRQSRAATVWESWQLGNAEWIRAQAWSARAAADAWSLSIKAEGEALKLKAWQNEQLQKKFAASKAQHAAMMQRGRVAMEAKQRAPQATTFKMIDVEQRRVRWPVVLQSEQYADACCAVDAKVSRRWELDARPTPLEALAVVEPLRERIDADYQQRLLSMDQWLSARKTLEGVQKELRYPKSTSPLPLAVVD